MRILSLFCATLLLSCAALAQAGVPAHPGYTSCTGPYIPMVTTPQVSLETVSANPVGASNATYGLVAGATNSTLSISNVNGNLGGTYTQPVWYAGGTTPLISSPAVQLAVPVAEHQNMARMEHWREHERAEGPRSWTYFASEETSSVSEAASSARSAKRATRTITNQDVEQVNQNNGSVKYDGKTEKIQ
ncbi:MAG TPA: hypothetical protein VFA85_03560 [Terriglobales bacterium]|nr:hypothetical protein [Terriglobales bacterium]